MKITKEITLDVSRLNRFQSIIAKQNDKDSRYLKVSVAEEGNVLIIPSSAKVTITATRPDKLSSSFLGKISEDGKAIVPLSPWMLELDGSLSCEVSIITEESVLKTTSFYVDVEPDESSGNTDVTQDPNYDILVELIQEVSAIAAAKEEAIAEAVNEYLSESLDFESNIYYEKLSSAISDIEKGSTENTVTDIDKAYVKVYTSCDGIKTIVLLNDLLETNQINITKNMIIDLGGKTLSFEHSAAYIQASCENLKISNGNIFVDISGGIPSAGLFRCTSNQLTMDNVSINVIGGISSQFIGLFLQNTNGVYDIKNCNIDVKNNLNAAVAIYHYQGILNIENTSIKADTDSAKQAYGLLNSDRANITDSTIFADAPDNSVDRNGYSIGIQNNKTLYATNTNVSGTHSGLSTRGSAYIHGGIYDSCSHGGMYIENNGEGETFVKDATIRCGDYTGIHDSTAFSNAKLAALYFGESSDSSNGEVAYFDGCTIEAVGANHVIALRDSHGDNINVFNISNSTISEGSNYIRTDGSTVKVNIGVGTNITKDRLFVDANYEYTDEMYRRFGEEEKVSGADANALVLNSITIEKVAFLMLEKSKQEHPVNSIFPSMSKTNPAEIFGFGEWQLIAQDRFLLGAGNKYEVGTEGGEETHKLTVEEMPSHSHVYQVTTWVNKTGDITDASDTEYIDYEKNRNTEKTGGDQPHNNMPPYLAVYFWLRTE